MEKILIELNQTCNLNCEYCFYRDYSRDVEFLTTDKINDIITSNIDLKKVYLTGGEATINKNFKDIIETFYKNNIKVTIFTNGVKLSEVKNLEDFLNPVEKYIVSYDHYKESYKYRLKLDCTINFIKKAISINKDKIVVKVCINKKNVHDLDNIFKYLIDLGVIHLSVNFIHNIKTNSNNFELSNEEIKEVFEIIDTYINYFDKKYILYLKDYFIRKNYNIESTCIAGDRFSFINCKGEEYICPANFGKKGKCLSKECICIWEMFYEE